MKDLIDNSRSLGKHHAHCDRNVHLDWHGYSGLEHIRRVRQQMAARDSALYTQLTARYVAWAPSYTFSQEELTAVIDHYWDAYASTYRSRL